MQLREAFALMIGLGVLLLVARSIINQWRGRGAGTPLRGKFKAAQEWLEANGYHILRVRDRGEWTGYYGTRAFHKHLIADFIVRQGGKTYVVKLASAREKGMNGAKLRDTWYPMYVVFGVKGILHVDVENEQVQVVDFEVKPPPHVVWSKVINRALWLLSGMLIALVWMHSR
ncbi:hypothetical protein JI721_15635 [Alicyclobacillus cycloheptanicus]|uniref:DUF3592 domain-containing protein n=1 Tax=Alicyclobacillus cycloheptanicus TaxID=1457 RepID=A0ABT9XDW5_9BACL|nr:hypothetical protein [Alicyclobacillus cycloheptanicus]MDQ0188372.1 hypothetical protein [Alicyclobacillus cycloheptanicus]WDM01079.1 hypothetical protein JI721_15635 [Alicyclobacillus cycloheptanicus]